MEFYALLATLTLVIGGFALLLWRQTKSIAILLGIGFLYYWSLFGAWSLVFDLRGGDSGMHYQYLFDKMFPVDLDGDYFQALVYLGLFVIAVEITLLWCLPCSPLPKPLPTERLIRISHNKLLILCGLAGLVSYFLIRDSLEFASSNNISAYLVTRGETDYDVISLFTLHATLNRLALFPAVIGLAVLVSGKNVRMVLGPGGPGILLAYAALLSAMFVFCLILGNKNELFVALVTGVLFYLANDLQPRKFLLGGLSIAAFAGVAFIDFVRGAAPNDVQELISTENVFDALGHIISSNEAFASHMSLYGCLHYEVPLTYGSSLVSLVASVVPRNLWPDRPSDIYTHYAVSVQAAAGQGYSIHHAAGWYLNFGPPGVLLGGVLLGWVWSRLFAASRRLDRYRSPAARLFFSYAALSFSAYLPTLIRAGPEVYKGAFIDALLVPFAVLWFSQEQAAETCLLQGSRSFESNHRPASEDRTYVR
ncbi:MAG TPA: hypothetical protein VMJ32_16880 [Pirellulales bacterium]|nr:hypothetical protein [Pirellulales bacterium]